MLPTNLTSLHNLVRLYLRGHSSPPRHRPRHHIPVQPSPLPLPHLLPRQAIQQPKVLDIERRTERVEDLARLIVRILKRMRCPDRHDHVVPRCSLDGRALLLLSGRGGCRRDEESRAAPRHEERFVVHFVPVGGRAGGVRGEGDEDRREALRGRCSVEEDVQRYGAYVEGFGGGVVLYELD
jgi:hypothetical protein